MSFFKNLFGKKDQPIQSYADFWAWFQKNEKAFHKVVKQQGDIEHAFFAHMTPQLHQLNDGYFLLTGMYDGQTVELVITAEGVIKNFVFVEELVAAAPVMEGWKFTALKPAINTKDFGVAMEGLHFDTETLHFYPIEDALFPDEIILALVHRDLTLENRDVIVNGCFVYLDNFLGELNVATTIDQVIVVGPTEAQTELIDMGKLLAYLKWREAEFVEKYEGERHDTEHDSYTGMTAELQGGNPLVAIINQDLLRWDRKASHPWMLLVEMGYDGTAQRGMPDAGLSELMMEIEDYIMEKLHDADGYLNIGRQTAENVRTIYFACREFRKPSKVMRDIQQRFKGRIAIDYEIHKDKYWRVMDRFVQP